MPEIKPGNWYFVVTCKNCQAAVAFGDALPAGVVDGIEVDHGPISIHCDGCGVDRGLFPSRNFNSAGEMNPFHLKKQTTSKQYGHSCRYLRRTIVAAVNELSAERRQPVQTKDQVGR